MIAASGSIAHFAFPVRVQKDGQFFCVAELVENGDERWLERVGRDPQGALYKMNNNLSGGHQADKKTRQYEPARDLETFALALAEDRPLETRAAYAYRQIDIPQCISYFVAMTLISSDDHGHKNYYLYRDSRHSGEWALLPWDVDLSWGRNWTGQYFNETMFVDNPLDLYRNGRSKPRNRLYNLFFEFPEFRQMYLRRLRTVMDELLQPPGTPAKSLIIENRIKQPWISSTLQGSKTPTPPSTMRAERPGAEPAPCAKKPNASSTNTFPAGVSFSSDRGPSSWVTRTRSSQPPDAVLNLGPVNIELPPREQFVAVTNPNPFAVDVTGWKSVRGRHRAPLPSRDRNSRRQNSSRRRRCRSVRIDLRLAWAARRYSSRATVTGRLQLLPDSCNWSTRTAILWRLERCEWAAPLSARLPGGLYARRKRRESAVKGPASDSAAPKL